MITTVIYHTITTLAVETTILPGDMCVLELILLILKILVYGLGVAATIGVVIAGIQYMTARDNESQVAESKKRLFNIVIGLASWAIMWTVMNWLIPGGMSLDASAEHDKLCPVEISDSTLGWDAPSSSGGNSGGNQGSSGSNNNQGSNGSQGNNSNNSTGGNGGGSNTTCGSDTYVNVHVNGVVRRSE